MKTRDVNLELLVSRISFDEVLAKAQLCISTLSNKKQEQLKNELNHGLAMLSTDLHINMYLSSYGEIHRQKLLIALKNMPERVWYDGKISIIDYGCGVGIAEMVLSDFFKSKQIDTNIISDIHLIEPSRVSLMDGIKNTRVFFPDVEIFYYNCGVKAIDVGLLNTKSEIVIHVFSNIIDIPEFEREYVAELLNSKFMQNNIVVCISPFYQENGRGELVDDFGKLLRNYICTYKFQRHTDDWNRNFSCQIRIFVNSYY